MNGPVYIIRRPQISAPLNEWFVHFLMRKTHTPTGGARECSGRCMLLSTHLFFSSYIYAMPVCAHILIIISICFVCTLAFWKVERRVKKRSHVLRVQRRIAQHGLFYFEALYLMLLYKTRALICPVGYF